MKKEDLLFGFLAGLLFAWIIIIFSINTNSQGMLRMMGIHNSNSGVITNSDVMDAHFIEQMIPHHEDAITMAKIAQTKSTHSEIKSLANSIIDTQTKEIMQMKDWYKKWFGRELPVSFEVMNIHGMMSNTSRMHMGTIGNESDITSLENAENFDKKFIEEMIPHHQMAVMMASMLKNGTTRSEMRQLADSIITNQSAEIDQMRKWYKDWRY